MKKENEVNEALKEKEAELLEKGWIKTWLLFDVQSNDKDYAEKALFDHINKLRGEPGVEIVFEEFSDVSEVEAPEALQIRGIKTMYSKICEMYAFFKNFETLVNCVVVYAPSAIEVLEPEKITVKVGELQSALTTIADMMHKFAQAGLGGVVISK